MNGRSIIDQDNNIPAQIVRRSMPANNKAGGICIRCEAWTKSYIGNKSPTGRVLCKHCAKAYHPQIDK